MRQLHGLLFASILVLSIVLALPVFAQEDPNCPGAPMPRLIVASQGRVLPGDANNVRDIPSRNGTKIGEIPGGETFMVLEGPVCADSLNWWHVNYNGLDGWTVEGTGTEYWVEPYDPTAPTATTTLTPLPTATPAPTGTPAPVVDFVPPVEPINLLEVGARVRVINDDPATTSTSISLRAEPSVNAQRIDSLSDGVLGTLTDGPQEADSLRWWKIEGLVNESTQFYERTLLPLCPVTENRITVVFDQYLYTANPDYTDLCILDHLRAGEGAGFWPYFDSILYEGIWSPDGSVMAFIDYDNGNLNLYTLSADGSERRQLTQDSHVYRVAWSPDGQRLAVARSVGERGGVDVWTMRADGSNPASLTNSDPNKTWTAWLDDSQTVIYAEEFRTGSFVMEYPENFVFLSPSMNVGQPERVHPNEYIFYTVNVLQGGLKEIFRAPLDVFQAELSPDRTHLALSGEILDEMRQKIGTRLLVIDLSTNKIVYDQEGVALTPFFWSLDGTSLISVAGNAVTTTPVLDSGEPTNVGLQDTAFFSDPETYRTLTLSPDGTVIYYLSGTAVYGLNVETGALEQVTP